MRRRRGGEKEGRRGRKRGGGEKERRRGKKRGGGKKGGTRVRREVIVTKITRGEKQRGWKGTVEKLEGKEWINKRNCSIY